ncbi:hypothetical protein L209DRAFT_750436 [Thermothelomyces heterothallicus CBS 203.75]
MGGQGLTRCIPYRLSTASPTLPLFNDLRNMTLTRDEGAPIKVSEAQIAKFRERRDIAKLRDEIQHTTDKLEKSRLRGDSYGLWHGAPQKSSHHHTMSLTFRLSPHF